MVGKAITFTLLLLLKGHPGQECQDSADNVVGLSGKSLWIRPSDTQTKAESVLWKRQLFSHPETYVILKWKNDSSLKYSFPALNNLNNTFDFNIEDSALLIKAAKPQDSGHYLLETTMKSGKVCTMHFKILIFDHVEKPQVQGQWKALEEGICQLELSCLVSRDDNVSYAWYRGNKLISTLRKFTYLERQIDANGLHTYSCNVSNTVSWASHTIDLTQSCLSPFLKYRLLPFLVIIVILVILFAGTLTCFCVWKRKRKLLQTSPKEFLTVYEDIKDLQIRRNQKQQEQTSSEEGGTINFTMQSQSRSKKRQDSPSFICTIYEEVGKRFPKAGNPARLSLKELETFDIYS